MKLLLYILIAYLVIALIVGTVGFAIARKQSPKPTTVDVVLVAIGWPVIAFWKVIG